jgi:hypothetical protein
MRTLGYVWAAPASCFGLAIATAGIIAGGRMTIRRGVIEVHGRLLGWTLRRLTYLEGGISAITFGHVVLAVDAAALEQTRAHERIHVHQYERWGALFIPAYLAASLWTAVRGRDPYFDNPFERQARELAE